MDVLRNSTLGTSSSSLDNTIQEMPYSLDDDCPVPWPSEQADKICQDYPFSLTITPSPEEYVIKTYLETLWLPDSIMPLHLFVRALQRILLPTLPVERLHDMLQPLLLSVRAAYEKYHQELPQILHNGGGAGELEETMMWYAFAREKFSRMEGDAHELEEARKSWMSRLERREVLIQILLYFYLLSLPKLRSDTSAAFPTNKKYKRPNGLSTPAKPLFSPIEETMASSTKSLTVESEAELSLEARLEFFMDKLSVWQIVASLNEHSGPQQLSFQPTKRDWMQTFCEDVVEPLFRPKLPELCDLLRSKVFPHSAFSDYSDSSPAPVIRPSKKPVAKERRPKSPLRLHEVEKRPKIHSRAPSTQASTGTGDGAISTVPQRHRSRSVSVSISTEEVRARGASRGGVASSKTLFKEEVEMKRTVSKGGKLFPQPNPTGGRNLSRQSSSQNVFATLNSGTMPPPALLWSPKGPKTLAVDTPTKKATNAESRRFSPPILLGSQFTWSPMQRERDEEDEEEPSSVGASQVFMDDTPIKQRKVS